MGTPPPPLRNHLTRDAARAAVMTRARAGSPESGATPRRLALVVGVGDYRSPSVKDLRGPPGDADRFARLLSVAYGFDPSDVVLLRDVQATGRGFREAFDRSLVQRARDDDIVVLFFAGHGSQRRDDNGDEPDGWDETLLFQDAREEPGGELLDDELGAMLARLRARARNVTVVLDACNAGSATRGSALPRFEPPAASGTAASRGARPADDGGPGILPADLSGMVVLSASTDGTPALEVGGRGVFTHALLQVLGGPERPLTWEQVARRVPPLMAPESAQIPYFQGALDRVVFDDGRRIGPPGWTVVGLQGDRYLLEGPPLPGWSQGAVVKVLDAASSAEAGSTGVAASLADAGGIGGTPSSFDARSTGAARSSADAGGNGPRPLLEIERIDGPRATARRINRSAGPTPGPGSGASIDASSRASGASRDSAIGSPVPTSIQPGDVAVLLEPGDDERLLRVFVRPAGRPGGVPAERLEAIRKAIDRRAGLSRLLDLSGDQATFELAVGVDGTLELLGTEGHVRRRFERAQEADEVASSLGQFARQQAFLRLKGDTGTVVVDHETLRTRLVPAEQQAPCADSVTWTQAPPLTLQRIPLCHRWRIEVTLDPRAPLPLLVGGVFLGADGGLVGFPMDGSLIRIEPGGKYTLDEVFQSQPPVDVQEQVMVFGTQERDQVRWTRYTDNAPSDPAAGSSRGASEGPTRLQRRLDRYFLGSDRGGALEQDDAAVWTVSAVPTISTANEKFLKQQIDPEAGRTREFTVQGFDVRPYLPGDPSSALHRLLLQADRLARYDGGDGVHFGSHPWTATDDEANLKRGIDASRAVWFAFTRAGLPYGEADDYLSSAQMTGASSAMAGKFDRCIDDPSPRTGDVLVFRDAKRGDGIVVLVIDPVRRIAWGSFGWDAGARAGGNGSNGARAGGNGSNGARAGGNGSNGAQAGQNRGTTTAGQPNGAPTAPRGDTGVEYQQIRHPGGWSYWDRPGLVQVDCWRHRGFEAELERPASAPGTLVFESACDDKKCGR